MMWLKMSCGDTGSPPCVRGRAEIDEALSLSLRFTPVRTGKRSAGFPFIVATTVHPRAYGEEGCDG